MSAVRAVALPARLFLHAAAEAGVPAREAAALVARLTRGFAPDWLDSNQKFDLSFAAGARAALRLSYNGFGEERAFRGRLRELAAEFGAADLPARWTAMLSAADGGGALSYFGLDWVRGEPPCLKIYLWELAPEQARAAAGAAGFARALRPGEAPRALCLAQGADGRPAFKAYFDARLEDARRWASRWGAAAALGRFEDCLGAERRAFGLLALRRDASGRALGAKWYKIYEVQRGTGSDALAEAERVWGAFGGGPAMRERLLQSWARAGLRAFVVAAGLSLGPGPSARADLYYSARSAA